MNSHTFVAVFRPTTVPLARLRCAAAGMALGGGANAGRGVPTAQGTGVCRPDS